MTEEKRKIMIERLIKKMEYDVSKESISQHQISNFEMIIERLKIKIKSLTKDTLNG